MWIISCKTWLVVVKSGITVAILGVKYIQTKILSIFIMNFNYQFTQC